MDFDIIRARFAWFGAEANSWGEVSDGSRSIAQAVACIPVKREDPLFTSVYDAYEELQAAFSRSTDGVTGRGYGAGSQVAADIKDLLLQTCYSYASLEEQNIAEVDRIRVEQLIANDKQARR